MAWHILKKGQEYGNYGNYMEYLIDSENDIQSPPSDGYAPGSFAHTAGFTHMYEAASDGTWTEIGGDE